MRRSILVGLMITAFVIGTVGSVFAYTSYLTAFNAKYGTSMDCGVCHYDTVNGGGTRNAYGNDFRSISSHSSNPGAAFDAIASSPSVCSGNTYLQMINQGLYPGGHGSNVVCPTPAPVACTDYAYSDWSTCDANGQQSRTQTGYLPANCTGTPSAQPVLTQACNSVPPSPTTGAMPVPAGAQAFSYQPVDQPVVSDDPAQAKPIGVGPLASGGNTIDLRVDIGPFSGPVDVSLVIYAPAVDSEDLYFIVPDVGLKRLSDAVRDEDEETHRTSSDDRERDEDSNSARRHLRSFIVWKTNVTSVNEGIFTAKVTDFPSGVYPLVLAVTSPDNPDNSYRWITYMFIP